MWRRIYLLLLLVRLYFALSPSYLHPDENFQGPEVIAGQVFSYHVHHTWEFTTSNPIRSTFPLWLVYGLPMLILRSLWEGIFSHGPPPIVVFWTLRVLMFTLSFVLEDWALQELVQSKRQRRVAMILVSSSYVTWTYQTHTFSNAIETLVVLWSLVMISRIVDDKDKHQVGVLDGMFLAFLIVLGVFNRITFPAYLALPALELLPQFRRKPLVLISLVFFGLVFTYLAISLDTAFYNPDPVTPLAALRSPIITPLNNLFYNTSSQNLVLHGLHPLYTHIAINLPLLLGPALPLLLTSPRPSMSNRSLRSALTAIFALSFVPHQEPRFLLPSVPLLLSCIPRLPSRRSTTRLFLPAWLAFNIPLGILMGSYHQAGVIPMQVHIASLAPNATPVPTGESSSITNMTVPNAQADAISTTHALWWRTYSPPLWLLDGRGPAIASTDLMGAPVNTLLAELDDVLPKCGVSKGNERNADVLLVAPASSTVLDQYVLGSGKGKVTEDKKELHKRRKSLSGEISLEEMHRISRHLNLDDIDVPSEGLWGTLKRVVGRRGLVLWKVRRRC